MDEKVKEQLKFEIEVLRLCVIGLLTIGSGVVSLILDKPNNVRESFFIAFGIGLFIVLVTRLYRAFKKIKHTLK